jgi:hypothetical protein
MLKGWDAWRSFWKLESTENLRETERELARVPGESKRCSEYSGRCLESLEIIYLIK